MRAADRETWWVLRAQSGDQTALDALLRSVQQPLFRYIRAIVANDASAEDVLQETFLRIYRKLGWLSDAAVFRPWAFRIASNESFRALKRERRWRGAEDEAVLEDIAAPDAATEPWLRDRMQGSLQGLPPASRAVLTLHYLEEMPLAEVAAILEIPLGTVKSRLAAGLARLRREFGTEGHVAR